MEVLYVVIVEYRLELFINTLAHTQSDVAGKPEIVLRVGMPFFLYVRLLYMTKRI